MKNIQDIFNGYLKDFPQDFAEILTLKDLLIDAVYCHETPYRFLAEGIKLLTMECIGDACPGAVRELINQWQSERSELGSEGQAFHLHFPQGERVS